MAPGQVFGLLGRNGSGKPSLAYTLMGCAGYLPSAGRILFAGQDVTRVSIAERAKLGLTLAWQESARFEGLRVQDYLSVGIREPTRAVCCDRFFRLVHWSGEVPNTRSWHLTSNDCVAGHG
jgi:Fe-S cluster assembly ATP-binding protein